MKKKRTRSILFATDFSRASTAALGQAIELAKAAGRELLIAHVVVYPGPMAMDGMVFPQVYEELEEDIRRDAAGRLAGLLKRVEKTGVRASTVLLRGVPHQAITSLARSRNAEMIVVGTHGRTGFSRLIVGSVASRVVASASCPVLTVR